MPSAPIPTAPLEPQTGVPWWARSSRQPYLRPDQVRTRTVRGTLTTVAFLTVLFLGVWWVLTATGVKQVTITSTGALAHKQTTNALIGGCGPMFTYPHRVADKESGIVPRRDTMLVSNRQRYRTIVPMFGRFWNDPARTDQRLWQRNEPHIPVAENLLGNMWTGTMVIYYTAAVPAADLKTLSDIVTLHPELDIIVAPWEQQVRGPMPQNRQIAFATWNASQSCHQLVAPAVYDFRKAYPASAAPGFHGRKPPILQTKPPLSVQTPN